MWAHRGIGGGAQLLEDVRHLLGGERVVGAHGGVAGHGRGDLLHRLFGHESAIVPFEVIGERAERAVDVRRGENRRHRGDAHAGPAKVFELEPEARQRLAPGQQRVMACAGQVEHHGHQQSLALERGLREALENPLEQHALVRHVLIDDHQAVVVHRHDERIAELAERCEHAFQPHGRRGVHHHHPGDILRAARTPVGRCRAGRAVARPLARHPRPAPTAVAA